MTCSRANVHKDIGFDAYSMTLLISALRREEFLIDFFTKPRTGEEPVSLNRLERYSQVFSRFFQRAPCEKTALDDQRGARSGSGQASESVVQRNQFVSRALAEHLRELVERCSDLARAALRPFAMTGVINEYATHRLRSDCDEMATIFRSEFFSFRQTDICFMHERRWTQRVTRRLSRQLRPGDDLELIIDERDQVLQRVGLTGSQASQPMRDGTCRHTQTTAFIVTCKYNGATNRTR